ncbi:MAG: class I SAM-dependent methyltransferase [Fimbriimonadia bacterium]|nr:class I SAM-dependent methyltransferase [Fimbriimonadia bacterium]
MKPQKPLVYDTYESIAEAYAAAIETKTYNAHLDRPSLFALLPEDLQGKCVLDAGCGPGFYSEQLLSQGAEVIAIDASPKMIELTQKRLGDRVRALTANLEEPLAFLPDESVDLIVSGLVMHYLRDWSFTLSEFYRVLRAPGYLAFSTGDPACEYVLFPGNSYHEIELVHDRWENPAVEMTFYRRPFSAIVNPLIEAGFRIARVQESLPTEAFRLSDPAGYEKVSRHPTFLCIRAEKA